MWLPRLRLRPSSCLGLCCPTSAPRAPYRRLFLLRLGRLFLGARCSHLRILVGSVGGWGLPLARAGPPGDPEAT